MKIYISAAKTIEQLKEQDAKGMKDSVFNELIALDPTTRANAGKGGKYCPWIIKHYKSGDLTPDMYPSLHDDLLLFAPGNRPFKSKDLNSYKTVQEFLDDSDRVMETSLTKRQQDRQNHKAAKESNKNMMQDDSPESADESLYEDENVKLLVKDGDWEVWTPKTFAGSIALAEVGCDKSRPYKYPEADPDNMKARWCTAASQSYYNTYTSGGPLYICINTKDPINKFQTNIQSGGRGYWHYDKNDRAGTKQQFIDWTSEHPKIAEFFDVKNEGGVLSMAGVIQSYDPNATEITLPETLVKFPDFPFPDSCKLVRLPDSMTAIPPKAFINTNIETVLFNNVDRIGTQAFRDSHITNINLNGIKYIGSSAFRNCPYLDDIDLDPDVQFGSYAFAEDKFNCEITITPEMKMNIGVFDNCTNLTVVWEAPDENYEFSDIGLLILNKETCPQLFENNVDYVRIQTTGGETYEVQ